MHTISLLNPSLAFQLKSISLDSLNRFIKTCTSTLASQSQNFANTKIKAVLPGNKIFMSCGKAQQGTSWSSLAVGENIILERDFGVEERSCCGSVRRVIKLALPEFSFATTKMRCCCGIVSRGVTFCLPPSLYYYLTEILQMPPDSLMKNIALQEAADVLLATWRTEGNHLTSTQSVHMFH